MNKASSERTLLQDHSHRQLQRFDVSSNEVTDKDTLLSEQSSSVHVSIS